MPINKDFWDQCDAVDCGGAVASDGMTVCLRHAEFADRQALLRELGGHLDIRGVEVTRELTTELIEHLTRVQPTEHVIRADDARFLGEVDLRPLSEIGHISCQGADFVQDFRADKIRFTGRATFRYARFRGVTSFAGARFIGDQTRFRGADFFQLADFVGASAVEVSFDGATFAGEARFVRFTCSVASFDEARFLSKYSFRDFDASRSYRFRETEFSSREFGADHPSFLYETRHSAAEQPAVRPPISAIVPTQPISIFLGSSTEALPVAKALEARLALDYLVLPWQLASRIGADFITSVTEVIDATDFAILVIHPDDVELSRGDLHFVARDNVIFELGLAYGRLGRERAFMVCPDQPQVRLPSDLNGVIYATYKQSEFAVNPKASLGHAMALIRDAIDGLGPRLR